MGRINTAGSGSGVVGMTWTKIDSGVVLDSGTSPVNVTINEVNTSKAIVKLKGVHDSTFQQQFNAVPELLNSTTLEIDNLGATTYDVYWEVWEIEGAESIQFVTDVHTATSTGATTYNIPINNVDPDKSYVILYDASGWVTYPSTAYGSIDATGDNLVITCYDEDTVYREVKAYIVESK